MSGIPQRLERCGIHGRMALDVLPIPPSAQSQEDLLRKVHPSGWQNPRPRNLYDLVILGGGPAGLSAAEFARRQGLSVALVERYRLGGNSLNSGSIPSKAIIRAARVLSSLRDEEEYGAAPFERPLTDFQAVMERTRQIRTRIAEYHAAGRLQAQGIDVFFAEARFVQPDRMVAGETPLSFKKALIATGARPRPSDIPGLDLVGYLTSDSIFDLAELPKRLGVIGGGPLGCELAQAFSRLGSRVTIVQNDPKFLPDEERDAAELLSMSLSRDGVDTRLNTTVVGAREEEGSKLLDTLNDGIERTIIVDEVLLSIGRVPNVESLGLAAGGIEFEAGQGINVDDFLRTTNADVYAAGDVCNHRQYANIAESSARLAVQNAFGARIERQSQSTIPWCTYCDPEIAHIGMHAREAREQSIPVQGFTVMMHDTDRAITDGQDYGFVKIYVRQGTDEILGATIVATRASDLINEMSVIMSAGIGMRRLATILHAYPAQSDAIRLAALAFVNGGAQS
jgi:pyruvate/2-oxoglutarate dehydrogenase complex dihydrolipoamide dehydrogenase (E3) component